MSSDYKRMAESNGGLVHITVLAISGLLGMQGVALRVAAEKTVFCRANILGAQDTLLDEIGSDYFYQRLIQGSTDFIFGNAKSSYQVPGFLFRIVQSRAVRNSTLE